MAKCKKCGGIYSFQPTYPDGEYCPTCLILRNANRPLQILFGKAQSNKALNPTSEDSAG